MDTKGKLAVYANCMGVYLGKQVVEELNKIIDRENETKIKEGKTDSLEKKVVLKKPRVIEFADTSLDIRIEKMNEDGTIMEGKDDSIRGEDAFLIQWFPASPRRNQKYTFSRNVNEFLITLSALWRGHVNRITLVTPYAASQRKDASEAVDSITSQLYASLFRAAAPIIPIDGFCFDIHAKQIIGSYNAAGILMDSFPVFNIFGEFINKKYPKTLNDAIVIPPDLGAQKRGRRFGEIFDLPVKYMGKERDRESPDEVEKIYVFGRGYRRKTAIIVDDIISRGGTIDGALEELYSRGLRDAYIIATHPVFSDLDKLDKMHKDDKFKKIFVLDTVELLEREWLVKVPIAPMLAQAIYNANHHQSVSRLYK